MAALEDSPLGMEPGGGHLANLNYVLSSYLSRCQLFPLFIDKKEKTRKNRTYRYSAADNWAKGNTHMVVRENTESTAKQSVVFSLKG
jgi:hypothetical protein